MDPSAHVCKSLYAMQKDLRYCYYGPEHSYGVVQLYHRQDFGNPDEPDELITMRMPWGLEMRHHPETETWEWRRADHGRIYNRWGGLCPDWDLRVYSPVLTFTLNGTLRCIDGQIATPRDICSRKLEHSIRAWLGRIVSRMKAVRKTAVDALEQAGDELSEDVNDRSNFMYRNVDNTSKIVDYASVRGDIHRVMEKAEKPVFDTMYQLPADPVGAT